MHPFDFLIIQGVAKDYFLINTLEKFGKTTPSKEIGFQKKMRRQQRIQTTLSRNRNKEGAQKKKGIWMKVRAIDIGCR